MIVFFKKMYQKLKRSIILSRYTDFTIAEYFRQQGASIGEDNRIEIRNIGTEPYLLVIENHCTIAPEVTFLMHDGGTWLFTEEDPSLQKFAPIVIRDNCFIGFGAIIMGNVTIGPNSIVGAGSVVTKDVPPETVVGGNPARLICTISEYKEKVQKRWAAQKPPGYFNGVRRGAKYPPAYIQELKNRDSELLRNHLAKMLWSEKTELPESKTLMDASQSVPRPSQS